MAATGEHLLAGLALCAGFLLALALGFKFGPRLAPVRSAIAHLGDGPLAHAAAAAAFSLALVALFNIALLEILGRSPFSMAMDWAFKWDHQDSDSWSVMSRALEKWRAQPYNLYDIFHLDGVKFQYPPSSLLPWLGVEALGLKGDFAALNIISRAFFLCNAFLNGAIAWVLIGQFDNKAEPRARLALALLCAAASWLFYPMIKSWWLGQIQTWMNAAFAGACLAWFLGRRGVSGALLALIVLIKPQFGLFLLWGLVRREWRFVQAFIGVLAVFGVAALAVFGRHNHLEYLDVLSVLSRHGEAYFNNQSLNGVLHRLFDNGSNLTFELSAFPPFHPFVYGATLGSSSALIALALWPRKSRNGVFDFLIAGLCFTLASPIAWEHHYGVLAPMLVAMLNWLATRPQTSRTDWVVFGAAAFATGMFLEFVNALAATPLNFVQSHLYFGALALLWLLWRSRSGGVASTPHQVLMVEPAPAR